MIFTKNLISDLKDVPKEWVFQHYLNLKEQLTGQDVKILSAFNAKDKVPSMCIYFDAVSNQYKFKDFSSGYQGDFISLVKKLFNLTMSQAIGKIITDYQKFILNKPDYKSEPVKFHDRFKVVDFEMRHWNNQDAIFWKSFKINSKMLQKYNVAPLSRFIMEKLEENNTVTSFNFEKAYLYGYFGNNGELYKIYMPKNFNKKFIKVKNYIQGSDQLSYTSKYLVITSSLKDLLCFNSLGIGNTESIAPDSENTMINESVMKKLTEQYTKVIILFDNDEPGVKAAQRYKDKYGFDFISLDMSKDLSDSVKDYGIEVVRNKLFTLMKETL
jgi:hypothetical protein